MAVICTEFLTNVKWMIRYGVVLVSSIFLCSLSLSLSGMGGVRGRVGFFKIEIFTLVTMCHRI